MKTKLSSALLSTLLIFASPSGAAQNTESVGPVVPMAPTQTMQIQPQASYYYDFGNWPVYARVYKDFSFSNYGRSALRIRRIAIYGTSFYSTHNCPKYLYGGYKCTIRVFFSPAYRGSFMGQLDVRTNGEDSHIYLSGYGY